MKNRFEREKVKAKTYQRFARNEGMQDSTRPLVAIGGIASEETPKWRTRSARTINCSHRFQAARRS
jgi:hypothetical protein